MTIEAQPPSRYAAVVIGSGFGGSLSALTLARAFNGRKQGEKVLILERGTWWTTPVPTVQDRQVETFGFLQGKGQPVQYWASANSFRGFIDIATRCVRRSGNEDGLYDVTVFGKRGLIGLMTNDGVSIVRASGVGGGSLVYSNITIQPPDFIFDDPRWPTRTKWDKQSRDDYYALARNAIGYGVLFALQQRDNKRDPSVPAPPPPAPVNSGLSNIITRTSTLQDTWLTANPNVKQIDPTKYQDLTRPADLLIDRARVFQTVMSELTSEYGTVDSSINDKPIFNNAAKNYCERQGRCNVGCLPGARHTLNKQLQAAIHGSFTGTPAALPDSLELRALCEATVIRPHGGGGYEVEYLQRDHQNPSRARKETVIADRVILAAGCVGTTELLLRCRDEGTLPGLSERVGYGFSTNGDYLAFLKNTKYHVSLTRGPVTTSFAHFNTQGTGDTSKFHTIEDQGIPPAFSSLVGLGVPVLQRLSRGQHRRGRLYTAWVLLRYGWRRLIANIRGLFTNYRRRAWEFESEDEFTMPMMCIAAQGREASVGRFRLGKGFLDTELRIRREDGEPFEGDPVYQEIRDTLTSFARKLTEDQNLDFQNPFLTEAAQLVHARSITLTHPLGGCIMGANADEGAVDEFGRVYDTTGGPGGVYDGLYVLDGAAIPTALGVNPSLTISALALRAADQIIAGLKPVPPVPTAAPAPTPSPSQ